MKYTTESIQIPTNCDTFTVYCAVNDTRLNVDDPKCATSHRTFTRGKDGKFRPAKMPTHGQPITKPIPV